MFQNTLDGRTAIVLYSNIHFGSIDTIQIEHRYVLNRIGQNASVHTKT